MIGLNDDEKTIELMVEEYKMSMGGSFFNKFTKEPEDLELEGLMIKNGINNHLFDTHELLSIYDNLSDYNKREFFQKTVVAFIKFKFNEDTLE